MSKKTIGVSPITNEVFIGRLNKAKDMWIGEKENITKHFNQVLNQYIKPYEALRFNIASSGSSNTIINVAHTKEGIEKAIKYIKEIEID